MGLNQQEVLAKVIVVAKGQVEVMAKKNPPYYPHREVYDESTQVETDLNFDSLDFVEFIMAIEDEFLVTVQESDYDRLRTLGQFTDYVNNRLD